jgi:hypothetical protein
VERLDPVAGDEQRVALLRRDAALRRVDLGSGNGKRRGRQLLPVEFPRRLDQRRIATLADIVDDGARGRVDVLAHLALGRQERREARLEIPLII